MSSFILQPDTFDVISTLPFFGGIQHVKRKGTRGRETLCYFRKRIIPKEQSSEDMANHNAFDDHIMGLNTFATYFPTYRDSDGSRWHVVGFPTADLPRSGLVRK